MEDVRIYGDFHGLTPEKFEMIKDEIPLDQVDYEDNVLRIDHEGVYIDMDDFIERMAEVLGDEGRGAVEFIDHVEWEVTRYTIEKGRISSKKVKVDNVLDAHMRDHGL
ncbi:hypothetical protein [Salidesulfovibrio brasiliensis]|uniref:hypothetical protein n=1 Tax=Salidesulfovibrio brasiliensis TaxID=221711 RepID=UPI0006D166AE|nr:hypothetical protein [Salidesulfovibrio brasiliensis]